jgi:hypothetical protein
MKYVAVKQDYPNFSSFLENSRGEELLLHKVEYKVKAKAYKVK